jgi:hypothetical protein
MYDAYYEQIERDRSDLHDEEPECECRFAGDVADASECELHHPASHWRTRQGRIQAAIETFNRTRREEKHCVNCKNGPARWDSLYCSDACKTAFLNFEVAI